MIKAQVDYPVPRPILQHKRHGVTPMLENFDDLCFFLFQKRFIYVNTTTDAPQEVSLTSHSMDSTMKFTFSFERNCSTQVYVRIEPTITTLKASMHPSKPLIK